MHTSIQLTPPISPGWRSHLRGGFLLIALTIVCFWSPQPAQAAASQSGGGLADNTTIIGDSPDSILSLAFIDDFSTDPNTNGQWTIHRYAGDPNTEATWDSIRQSWHLTLPSATYRGVAVFANYDLTATEWRAEFQYNVSKLGGVNGGGDGFVFMFYKDKDAYGKPAYGTEMGFSLSNGQPVAGYGLQFDNYDSGSFCDPTSNNYIALIQDTACGTALDFREDDRTADSQWHTVQFTFTDGKIRMSIDGETTWTYKLANPDYSFSGVGFSAGTGAAVEDAQIDNFRLWVRPAGR